MVTLAAFVDPPVPQAPALSLVRAADTPADTTGGRWALDGITYQPYTTAVPAVDDPCGPSGTGLPAIGALSSSTATSGGTLVAATYGYKVSALGLYGEGLPSAEKTQVVPAGTSTNTVTLTWAAVAGATGYRVYGRTSGGPWGLLATVDEFTLTWTDTGAGTPGAAAPTSSTSGTLAITRPSTVEWRSYLVRVFEKCSLMSGLARDYADIARAIVEAGTPKAVEREFWDGRFTRADGGSNLYLTKSGSTVVNPTPGTAVSFARGLRLLEQALADHGHGAPGFIHCRPETIDDTSELLRRQGNVLLTLRDTVVVPGTGYSGLGPQGDSNEKPAVGKTWMYATGPVRYRATAVEPVPDWDVGPGGRIPAAAVDRATNTVQVWGRRTALAEWDGRAHFAVYVDLPA